MYVIIVYSTIKCIMFDFASSMVAPSTCNKRYFFGLVIDYIVKL